MCMLAFYYSPNLINEIADGCAMRLRALHPCYFIAANFFHILIGVRDHLAVLLEKYGLIYRNILVLYKNRW